MAKNYAIKKAQKHTTNCTVNKIGKGLLKKHSNFVFLKAAVEPDQSVIQAIHTAWIMLKESRVVETDASLLSSFLRMVRRARTSLSKLLMFYTRSFWKKLHFLELLWQPTTAHVVPELILKTIYHLWHNDSCLGLVWWQWSVMQLQGTRKQKEEEVLL